MKDRVQEPFLNDLRKRRTRVAIYLKSGVRVEGIIASFDTHVIEVKGTVDQIIFKQMITTISPNERGRAPRKPPPTTEYRREPRPDAPRPSVIVKRRRPAPPRDS